MKRALALAQRGYGRTSPNPMVGAVIVKRGKVIAEGWHHAAGRPHAEIEALEAARRRGRTAHGATLYVTLEPCSTHGRTPPCTAAIIAAGIRRVVAAAEDPNPAHRGAGFRILERAGIEVSRGLMAAASSRLNEAFHHWIVKRTPFVIVKAGMSLDGRIAAKTGQSHWITSERARRRGMRVRAGMDAILAGVNTIVQDDPRLTLREPGFEDKALRRIILDPSGRTPPGAKVLNDELAQRFTTVVVTRGAPRKRVEALQKLAQVWAAPARRGRIDLAWVLRALGEQGVVSLLVEGGGETNVNFLREGLAQRVMFYYAPIIIGGARAPKAVGGRDILSLEEGLGLREAEWEKAGDDLCLTALID